MKDYLILIRYRQVLNGAANFYHNPAIETI